MFKDIEPDSIKIVKTPSKNCLNSLLNYLNLTKCSY